MQLDTVNFKGIKFQTLPTLRPGYDLFQETMELYKRMPTYRDAGLYRHREFCSNCEQNEHEDVSRGVAMHRRRTRNYEKHCPSCHCPPERRRFSSPGRPRTSENVEAMINRCERVFADPISSAIKKSQSSPLSQKLCWYECQTDAHSRCPKRSLQAHRRRLEQNRYLLRMKGDAANLELTNEDIASCSRYGRAVPVKSLLKKHGHYRQAERSPDERECSDPESEVSLKYTPRVLQSRKSRVLDSEPRRRYVGIGDGEDVAETRNDSDVESQEMRKLVLGLEDLERLKRGDGEATVTISEDDKRLERRRPAVARTAKSRKSGDVASRCVASKSSTLIGQSINKPMKELVLNRSADLSTNLDLHAAKTRILESIDRMLGTMDNTKNDTLVQQEQTEQETLEKITRELQESGWQLLFNGLTTHKNSTDTSRRIVRLECLNHIRQQLDKLYALESILDNCPPKLQPPSSRDMPRNEERQQSQHQLEQKTAES